MRINVLHSVRRLLQGGISLDVLLILILVYAVAGYFPSFAEWFPSFFGVLAVYLLIYSVVSPGVVLPLLLLVVIVFLACLRSPRLVPVSRTIFAIALAFASSGLVLISHTTFLISLLGLGMIFFGRSPGQLRSRSRRARFAVALPLLSVPIFLATTEEASRSFLTLYDNAGLPGQFFSVAVDSNGNIYSSLKHAGRVIGIAADSNHSQPRPTDRDAALNNTDLRASEGPAAVTNQIAAPERFAIAADDTVYVANRGAGYGVFSLARGSPSPKQILSTGAIDLIADNRNHRILALGELNGELAIYDTKEQTQTYLRLPPSDTTVFAISNGLESGEYFLSMGFHGSNLLRLRIDYDTNAYTIDRLPLGFFAFGLFLHEQSGLLYVSRPLLGFVDVIDARRFERVKRIRTPMLVREIAVTGDGTLLFAANYVNGTLWVIRTDSGERCAMYATAEHPRMIEYSAFHDAVFVTVEDQLMALTIDALPPECFAEAGDGQFASIPGSNGLPTTR